MPSAKEYALYRGDEFVDLGTIKQLAKSRGIKESSLRFYCTASYLKRLEERNSTNALCLYEIKD